MNKQNLIELGLTEEQAGRVMEGFDGAYVPKERFNQINERMKAAEQLARDTRQQLDSLRAAGDPAELAKQLEEAKAAAKKQADGHKAAMNALELTYAIRAGLSDAQDADIVAGLLDREKLTLEGGRLCGLEEQLQALREQKPFLFRQAGQRGGFSSPRPGESGGAPAPRTQEELDKMTMEEYRAYRSQAGNFPKN